eukprot:gnl/MRDRNA2_/MRDRNA2_96281_c0_seq1.p1 gnl/MRDRNA2_/MRDRNA2_96281_c0~~gnl/MRDRNA2_/MRDRNA2_96281_c0_seq1.p1  ORF type:complete len:160 (-),score=29.18 gnl/MRDRNA2_/MRDRNA2_96281_c0_seq1:439-918(-)
MALVGMLGYGDIYKKKAAMANPQEEKQKDQTGNDGAESVANTTAPPTPLSVATSSPALMPLSRSGSDDSSVSVLSPPIEADGASVPPKCPAGHGNGDTYRFRDRHGAMRYTTAGYATDAASQERSCYDAAGVGRGTRLEGACRIPCRRYGRDGRMAYRY